jgi:hypothetical protein
MKAVSLHALALSASLVGLAGGCGEKEKHPETVPVQGKVTYKGAPVILGTITFLSDSGQPATGKIQPDGTYRLGTFAEGDGAVPGHHKVQVVANDGDPTKMPGSSPGYKPPKDLVPKKYNEVGTSGLDTTVSKDKSTYDFDLK